MSKKVICIETNEIYTSATEAAKANGTTVDMVSNVCRGVNKSTKGKTFRYLDADHNIPLCVPDVPVTKMEVTIQQPAKMVAKGKRCNGNTNAVLCISTGQVFTSCTDAAEQMGTKQSNMSNACRGVAKTTGGKRFCYVKDINEHLDEVAESIRKANMYDELMTKREKYEQLRNNLGEAECKVKCIEYDIERMCEQLAQARIEAEKAKHNLMHFEW